MAALLCLLVLATTAAWNRRFEAVDGSPLVRVEDGSGVGFELEKGRGENPIARTVGLPTGGSVGILHVRFSFRAVDFVAGEEAWENGRLILDWVDSGGRVEAHDTLVSLEGREKEFRSMEMIVRSVGPGLRPVLRAEHLGVSGRMEIRSLQAVSVRERAWVVRITGALLGMWGMWCYGFVRCLTKVGRWRVVCAAAIVLAMGWFLSVPGPWAHERPIVGNFQMKGEPDAVATVSMAAGGVARDVEPLGEMPLQGSWLLWVKKVLSFLRPVLHVMLFAGPAFVIAVLCGTRCAWWCGVLASCVVEAGQAGFGYGFDWLDAIDLLVDWAGIGGAIWVYGKAREWLLDGTE